jgi:hypothetical protein
VKSRRLTPLLGGPNMNSLPRDGRAPLARSRPDTRRYDLMRDQPTGGGSGDSLAELPTRVHRRPVRRGGPRLDGATSAAQVRLEDKELAS